MKNLCAALLKYKARYSVTTIIIFMLVAHASAARKPYLRPGNIINIPSIGLKMKMPKYAKANPAKSLTIKTLTRRKGSKVDKIDACQLEELWQRDQLCGSYGNTNFMVSVYEMRLIAPDKVKSIFKRPGTTFVLKTIYEEWQQAQQAVVWDEKKMRSWLRFLLTESSNAELKFTLKNFSSAATIYEIKLNNKLIYIVTSKTAPVRHLVIRFKLLPLLDYKKSLRAIKSCLSSIKFNVPEKLNKNTKKLTISSKKIIQKKDWSPQYIASRKRVINNIKNLEDWWYLETENFIIVANIENRKTIKELQGGLEKSRNVFTQIYPVKAPLQAVSVVKAFETRQEYIAYVGKQYEWTGGLWVAAKKELTVSPMNFGSERKQREAMVNVIQHEGFHQYIYFATGEQHTAVWFNEGNATFFEGIDYKGKNSFIKDTKRLTRVAALLESADINRLLSMSHREFYGINKNQNYTLAYGLMFFLHKGSRIMSKKYQNNYEKIPTKYYQAILKNRNAKQATKIAWQGVDMKKFNKAFNKFWSKKSLIKKAIRYKLLKKISTK